jgi:hypothetical protein
MKVLFNTNHFTQRESNNDPSLYVLSMSKHYITNIWVYFSSNCALGAL